MPTRCPECGSFVKKDAESCPRCGADLNAIPLTEPKETQIEELTAGSSGNKNRENYPRLIQEFTAYYNKYQQLTSKAIKKTHGTPRMPVQIPAWGNFVSSYLPSYAKSISRSTTSSSHGKFHRPPPRKKSNVFRLKPRHWT